MAELIAIFNPQGTRSSLDPLVARLPSHAERCERWQDARCAIARLGHGVVDTAPQPVWDEAGTLALFADGELFTTNGPDETALQLWLRLYQAGRIEALAELNGSFALAIYDAERGRLTLITDRLGSRPLYYFQAGSEFVVASHVAALTGHPHCPKNLDRQVLHELVALQRTIDQGTLYHGLRRMEPASVLSFDGRTAVARRYWTLRWRKPEVSRQDAPAAFADIIRRAVRRRVSPNLRTGLLLSGGLDSRAMLTAADPPPTCFTQAPVENQETEIAREAARLRGAPFHFMQVTGEHYEQDFDEAARICGGMQRAQHSHFLPMLPMIKQHCEMLLSGFGFDAIYRGHELPGRRLRLRGHAIPLPMLQKLRKDELVPAYLASASYALPPDAVRQTLTAAARNEHDVRLQDIVRMQLADFALDEPNDLYNAWDYLSLRSIGEDDAYPNVLCMRSWMSERIPALDTELFDFYLQMPPQWRHPDGVYLRALRHLFPPALLRLKTADTGFPASLPTELATPLRTIVRGLNRRSATTWRHDSWVDFAIVFRRPGLLHQRLRALPESEAMMACGIFDPAGLRAVVDQHMQSRRDHSKLLMMLLTIESWVKQFGADGVS